MCFPGRNPGDVLETFNFLENADDSDEDEDEEGDMMEDISDREKHRIKKHKIKVKHTSPPSLNSQPRTLLLAQFEQNGSSAGTGPAFKSVVPLLMCVRGQEMDRGGLTLSQQNVSLNALTFGVSK